MAKITPKENFMRLVKGGHPEYVPFFTMMGTPYLGEVADAMMMPGIFNETNFQNGGKDMWGVPHKSTTGMVNVAMPDTSINILPDIEDWREIVKRPVAPKVEEIDWDAQYAKDLKLFNINREQSAVKLGPGLMPFQQLVAMMGFTNGLMALYEDPDEVLNMLHYMVDFLEPYYTKYIDVYKPDLWYMLDDTCAKEMPFFSPEIYRTVFKPIYERLAKPANDRGIPIIFHICGKFEAFVDDMIDFGVSIVEPTQEANDILMMKKKYKGQLGIIGGWDWGKKMPKDYPKYDEEELRQSIRDTIDLYAPGGGYGFAGWPISYDGDTELPKVQQIVRDEAHWYGRKVYGYKD